MATISSSSSQPSKKMKSTNSNSSNSADDGFSLQEMPEDLLRHVAQYLAAPDILRMLCVHPHIHKSCGSSSAFWNMLSRAHHDEEDPIEGSNHVAATSISATLQNYSQHDTDSDQHHTAAAAVEAKKNFLLRAYTTLLPRIRWVSLANRHEIDPRVPDSREGHLACTLGTKERPIYVFNGGFTDDANVYCMYKSPQNSATAATAAAAAAASLGENAATTSPSVTWVQLNPSYSPPNLTPFFVYGASLTRLDERRAIRFGGFQSGGYTGETNQVAVLTVDLEHADGPTAHWQVLLLQGGVMAQARAYHTATLLQDRYLLIVGGMTSGGSILQEAILDTQTWQWLNVSVSVSTFGAVAPSGRHGHSLVLDARRNRFVLFGGGNGTDLLRSGVDNTEVWELNMAEFGSSLWKTDLIASLPWRWKQIYTSRIPDTDEAQAQAAAAAPPAADASSTIPACPLSLGEALCLGRCHVAFRVSLDSVIFAFGSGRPSTNGALAYDLRTDTFLRPRVQGSFPRPRFTAAAVLIEEEGYVLVHGGYSTQGGDTTHEFAALDLAPSLQRSFDWLPVREEVTGHPPIASEDVRRVRSTVQQGGTDLTLMLRNLTEMTPEMRARMAMQYMGAGGVEAHNANLLRIIIGAHQAQMPARQHDINEMMESLHQHMAENDDDEDDEDDDDDDFDDDDDEDEEDDDMSEH